MKNIVDLTGKKIMVTGASSGIGRQICILLSQLGVNVALVARNEAELQKTVLSMDKGNHSCFICDLSDMNKIGGLVKQIVDFDGVKLDGYVHSAGVMPLLPLKNLSYKLMDEVMRVNYYSFIELVKQYSMKSCSNGGNIVAISSIAASYGAKCQTIYAASKAALDISVASLSKELYRKGIRLNSIRPGLIGTDKVIRDADDTTEGGIKKLSEKQLLGLGKPEDVANVIAFLLSEASSFIVGATIDVSGGIFL